MEAVAWKRASVASDLVAGREYTLMTARRRGGGTFFSRLDVVEAAQRHFQPADERSTKNPSEPPSIIC